MSEIGFPEASRPGEQPKITKLTDFSAEALGQLVQWLNTQLEVPINQIIGYSTAIFQAGTLQIITSDIADDGWLLCDGAAIGRVQYAALFTKIATKFGVGDGSTTFNLPDLRGRVPVGKGTNADVNTIGNNDGVAVGNRRPKHRHTPHSHTWTGTQFGGPYPTGDGDGASQPHVFSTSADDGGSGNANDSLDAPAYLVVNFQIKT